MRGVSNDSQAPTPGGEELQHLKRVSRVKHIILQKYFPSWAMILGSRNSELAYVDCFAGPGEYEMDGNPVEGSPVIVVKEAIKLVQGRNVQSLLLHLVDNEPEQVERLKARLKDLQPYPPNLTVEVTCADSRSFVPDLLHRLHSRVPAFFSYRSLLAPSATARDKGDSPTAADGSSNQSNVVPD